MVCGLKVSAEAPQPGQLRPGGPREERYLQAQKVCTLIADDHRQAFHRVDVICCPTTITPAFRLGERTENPLAMYRSYSNTVCSSLAGLPAISVPCGLAGAYEEASGFRNLAAPLAVGGEV